MRNPVQTCLGSLCVSALLFSACAHEQPAVAPKPVPATAVAMSADLVEDLSLITTGATPDDSHLTRIVNQSDVERYIDTLLADRRFAEVVAPRIVLRGMLGGAGSKEALTLNSVTVGSPSRPTIIYYRPDHGACTEKEAITVRPWWALETEVKICADSYQPTITKGPKGFQCGGSSYDNGCGCGPNLVFCIRDDKLKEEIRSSLRNEVALTIAKIVSSDRPLSDIFLTNETVRDRNAEMVYRRWRVASGEPASILADLGSWPTEPKAAPRFESTPGQHAGVLTTGGLSELDTGGRPTLKMFYQILWGAQPTSSNVDAATVFSIGTADLRLQSGWQKLAAMPICTDCHARLDYGSQFFHGYTYNNVYNPKEALTGVGKLFVRNIRDLRGEVPLDPYHFAQLAIAQPEFINSMKEAIKIAIYVRPGESGNVRSQEWGKADEGALDKAFAEHGTLKAAMRAALLSYVAHELTSRNVGAASSDTDSAPSIEQDLRHLLDEHCVECHNDRNQPDLRGSFDRSVGVRMLDQITSGRMPQGTTMLAADRNHMAKLLIGSLWSDPKRRQIATQYYLPTDLLDVHAPAALVATINQRSGGPTDAVPLSMTNGLYWKYSPEVAAVVAFEALRACKAAGKTQADELQACVDRATAVDGTVPYRIK